MPRVIWKGAVSFGLVHIPVSLVPASGRSGIDFDWLDKRSMEPVGYKRVNKVSGEEMKAEDIVKGVEYRKGEYVVLSENEIRDAHPEATQTVDIVAFIEAGEIPPLYLDRPYFLAPERRGEKVYALLREALRDSGKVGLARVVMHSKQHLAALMPWGDALLLETLRWAEDVRGVDSLELKAEAVDAKLAKRELDMAKRLIEDMSEPWEPEQYHDDFQQRILKLVEQKAKNGKLEAVSEAEAEEGDSAEVIDLSELLKRSLRGDSKASSRKPSKRSSSGARGGASKAGGGGRKAG